jgi:Carbohydrate binding module (family 6)
LSTRAAIGILFFVVGACASHDESLGCAGLVVSCPAGVADQQWWLTADSSPISKTPTSSQSLEIQGRQCGRWLAFIQDGASARYDAVDLGTREGQMRLRVVVAADDANTPGGTLTLFADDTTTPVASCAVAPTGGWFNWLVIDCGPLTLRGVHSLTFKFSGTAQYVFNFAAFGEVRSGSPDCTVTGPKLTD